MEVASPALSIKLEATREGLCVDNENPADTFESPDLSQLPGQSSLTIDHKTDVVAARVQKEERQKRYQEQKEYERLLAFCHRLVELFST